MPTEPTGRGTEIRQVLPKACPNGHPVKYPHVTIGSDVTRLWVLCRLCGLETSINHQTGEQTVVQRTPG